MAEFINHNSFLMTLLFIWLGYGIYQMRQGNNPVRSSRFIVLSVILLAVYFGLRPDAPTTNQAAEVQARISAGKPVLLEFQSPN